jgi:hypothetical protein
MLPVFAAKTRMETAWNFETKKIAWFLNKNVQKLDMAHTILDNPLHKNAPRRLITYRKHF